MLVTIFNLARNFGPDKNDHRSMIETL